MPKKHRFYNPEFAVENLLKPSETQQPGVVKPVEVIVPKLTNGSNGWLAHQFTNLLDKMLKVEAELDEGEVLRIEVSVQSHTLNLARRQHESTANYRSRIARYLRAMTGEQLSDLLEAFDNLLAGEPEVEPQPEALPAEVITIEQSQNNFEDSLQSLVKPGAPSYSIKVSQISPFKGQPRRYFEPNALEQLSLSMEHDGQNSDVLICHPIDSSYTTPFMLADGERRWRAKHLEWKRTGIEPTIEAKLIEIKDFHELFKRSMLANLHNERMQPLEEAEGLANLHKGGETLANLARLMGKSVSHVSNYLKVAELPDRVKEYLSPEREVQLSISGAIVIARVLAGDEKQQLRLAQRAVADRLSLNEIKSFAALWASNDESVAKPKPSSAYEKFSGWIERSRKASIDFAAYDVAAMYKNQSDARKNLAWDLNEVKRLQKNLSIIEQNLERVGQGQF